MRIENKKAIFIIDDQNDLSEEQKNLLSEFDINVLTLSALRLKKELIELFSADRCKDLSEQELFEYLLGCEKEGYKIMYLLKYLSFPERR